AARARPMRPRSDGRESHTIVESAVGATVSAPRRAPAMPATTMSPITQGISAPLGASVTPDGVNFSVFSRQATAIEILLFDGIDDARPTRSVRLDPTLNRTFHYWHAFVPGLRPGQLYGYRVEGPFAPDRGLRFDPAKLLLDPY